MTPTQAHARFAWLQDHNRDALPVPDTLQGNLLSVLSLTGAAMLSGGLPDLPDDASDDQLVELARHGIWLVDEGLRSLDDWQAEVNHLFTMIEAELLADADPTTSN